MNQEEATKKNESTVSAFAMYINEKFKKFDGMTCVQIEKRITDIIFEFEMRFHHIQPSASTPLEQTRFVSRVPNTMFPYTDFLNSTDLSSSSYDDLRLQNSKL